MRTFVGAALCGCLLLTGCATSIQGQLTWRSRSSGDWTMQPDNCFSGVPYAFYGVTFKSDGVPGVTVDYVRDVVHGEVVVVRDPLRHLVTKIRPDRCTVLEGDLEPVRHVRIGGVRPLDGRLRLSCTTPDGSTLVGALDFEMCSM